MRPTVRIFAVGALLSACLAIVMLTATSGRGAPRHGGGRSGSPVTRTVSATTASASAVRTATASTTTAATTATPVTSSTAKRATETVTTVAPTDLSARIQTEAATFTDTGTTVPQGFLGISLEYWEIPRIAADASLFRRIVNLLRPQRGDTFYLRVGGDSADETLWSPGLAHVPDWTYPIGYRWLSALRRLVAATHVKLIVDLNLFDEDPAAAATQAGAILHALPHDTVAYFEIGNEPDLFDQGEMMFPPHRDQAAYDRSVANYYHSRRGFTPADYAYWFERYGKALATVAPNVPLAGPATSSPNDVDTWIKPLLAGNHARLGLITIHHYPLNECVGRSDEIYPTVPRLLSWKNAASRMVHREVELARDVGLPVRLTEFNSVTCGGNRQVSHSFATALWSLNAAFSYLQSGVSGVNIHIRTTAQNSPFAISRLQLRPNNLLYGLALFSRALIPGASLLSTKLETPDANFHVWGIRSGTAERFVAVNTSQRDISLRLHIRPHGLLYAQRLSAPSCRARYGIWLAGQRIDGAAGWHGTRTLLGYRPDATGYLVSVGAYSAVLLSTGSDDR